MAARKVLHVPLVILCLALIRGATPLPTASEDAEYWDPSGPRGEDWFPTDNYDRLEDPTTTVGPRVAITIRGSVKRCDFDLCLENQIPCFQLQAATGCSCPGSTPSKVPPEKPSIRSVTWNGSEVVVRWCAPLSYVTGYVVKVGGEDGKTFGKDRRGAGVGRVEHISRVCVTAVNDAGHSGEACTMYQPADDSTALKAGLIGGALGLLLLLLLAVLLCRHRRQRKQEASISMRDTAETQQ